MSDIPDIPAGPMPRRSVDEQGRLIPLTEEEAQRRAEEARQALRDVAEMGDEDEQRRTLDALLEGLEEGRRICGA